MSEEARPPAARLQALSPARKRLLASITVLIAVLAGLVIAEVALRYQARLIHASDRLDPGMIQYDARLGWRLKAGWQGQHRHHDFDAKYRINRAGFRGADWPPTTRHTLAVYGDSFTFGQGVNDDETFTALLHERRGLALNLGVPGYATDQSYLLMRKTLPALRADTVLMVVYLANDLIDNERPYPVQGAHGKPYFRLQNDGLQLTNTPVPRTRKPAAARHESLARIVLGDNVPGDSVQSGIRGWLASTAVLRRLGWWQASDAIPQTVFATRLSSALTLFEALARTAHTLVGEHGGELKIVLLPGASYVQRPDSLSARYQDYLRAQIIELAGGLAVIDVASGLRAGAQSADASDWYFKNEGHLTQQGHREVALLLQQALQ